MKKIIENLLLKVSSYDILNNFIPGIIYCILVENMTTWSILTRSIWENMILFYLTGLVISRIGSIIIEPILKSIKIKKKNKIVKFIQFAPYSEFVEAEKMEPKIEKLSMINNSYRTFIATFICVGITISANFFRPDLWNCATTWLIGCFGLAVLFVFSYKKQTDYVRRSVEEELNNNSSK